MGDSEKSVDEAQETVLHETVSASEGDGMTVSGEAVGTDVSKLKLAATPDDPDDPEDAATGMLIGDTRTPRKKGLGALFGGAKEPDEGDFDSDASKWSLPGARTNRQGGGIRVVNRILMAAVVLILLFGVLDLSATIGQHPGGMTMQPGVAIVPERSAVADGDGADTDGLPVLANILESFAKRPIVRDLDRGGGQTTVQVVQTASVRVPDWKVEAQKLDLIGLSGTANGEMEAIVADHESSRMHFLRLGQEMTVGQNQFKLVRIATDHVVFEKDGDEVVVK